MAGTLVTSMITRTTQGGNLNDLKEHLKDLFHTFRSEEIPGIRKVEELEVA